MSRYQSPEVTQRDKSTFIQDPRADDVILVLIGLTGVGKSTFVNTLLGKPVAKVGEEVESETQNVLPYRLERAAKHRVFIVDTPGFNDTHVTPLEILRRVAVWLANSYSTGQKVGGILFLQDISAARMHRSSKKVIRMFEQLCGKEAAKRVLFLTTKWDTISPEIGARHEVEIINYWKGMLTTGSRIKRYDGQQSSAKDIIDQILQQLASSSQIQEEMVKEFKATGSTKAGIALTSDLGEPSLLRRIFCCS